MIENVRIITSSRKKMSTDITSAEKSSVEENVEGEAKVLLTGGTNSVYMSHVLFVPDLQDNFLLVGRLCDDGHTVMSTKNACTGLNGTTVIKSSERRGGAYVFGNTGRSTTERAMAAEDGGAKMPNLWHARFRHADRRINQAYDGQRLGLWTRPE